MMTYNSVCSLCMVKSIVLKIHLYIRVCVCVCKVEVDLRGCEPQKVHGPHGACRPLEFGNLCFIGFASYVSVIITK